MPEFKDRLKECRQAKGLRQQDAAEQLGIIYRTYRRYETGETEPTISVAAQLADFPASETRTALLSILDYTIGRDK